ncbi:MAG TPA: aspartate/glutamate racemase family protein, partial [Acidimicrobiales bacterium]
LGSGHHTIALLGTKYLIEGDFYSDRLHELGVTSIKPTEEQTERLQFIIFSELTRGVVTKGSRAYLREVASSCLERGASVVGLCCTEFGMLMSEAEDFPVIDSTKAHVRALLAA